MSNDALKAGWYRLPGNPDRERYWNGSRWKSTRASAPGSVDLPPGVTMDVRAVTPSAPQPALAVALQVFGVLTLIGGVIAGASLMAHTRRICVPNDYIDDCTKTHPFTGAGAGVLVGGVVQALVLFALAAILIEVRRAREATSS